MDAPARVAAIILAGGLSTRFGADKTRAIWRGRPLAEHVLGRLPAEREQTIVVLRHDQDPDAWPGAQVVRDDPSLPEGPLRGVIAGLGACATPLAWVVACDQPLIEPSLLRGLLAAREAGKQAVLPCWRGHLQPLPALVAVEAAAELSRLIARGEGSLLGALRGLALRTVTEEQCRALGLDEACFANINRRDDLDALST